MRKTLFLLLSFCIVVGGCKSNDASKSSTRVPDEVTSTSETSNEFVTDGLKAMGYPFKDEVAYHVTGMPGGTVEDVRIAKLEATPDGKQILTLTWKGTLATTVGNEVYECTPEGILAKSVINADVKPSFMFLPAKLDEGKTWNAKYSVAANTGQNLEVTSTYKILGTEKVKVKLGEFETVVVQESGNIKIGDVTATLSGKTWYAMGIGMIKTEATQTVTAKDGKQRTNKLTFEAVPLPKK